MNKNILSFFNNNKKTIILDNYDNESNYNNIYYNLYNLIKKHKIFNTLLIIISDDILKKNKKYNRL